MLLMHKFVQFMPNFWDLFVNIVHLALSMHSQFKILNSDFFQQQIAVRNIMVIYIKLVKESWLLQAEVVDAFLHNSVHQIWLKKTFLDFSYPDLSFTSFA